MEVRRLSRLIVNWHPKIARQTDSIVGANARQGAVQAPGRDVVTRLPRRMDPRVGLLNRRTCQEIATLHHLPSMKALDLRRRLLSPAQLLHRGPARRKSGAHDMGAVESDEGFYNSIGLLVKAQRLGLRIGEVPALRLERKQGTLSFESRE